MAENVRLSSQLPRNLSELLSLHTSAEPVVYQTRGVILVADVSGFTRLVEEAARTRFGLEELAREFSDFSLRAVEAVYARGGDVLSITGDGFLCFWEAPDDGSGATVVAKAVDAALHLTSIAVDESDGQVVLPVRAGVALGPLTLGLIGGSGGQWQVVAAGKALKEAIAAERSAAPEGVVAAPLCWSLVADRFSGKADVTGSARVTSAIEGDDEEVPEDQGTVDGDKAPSTIDWSAEVRRVTALILQLPDLEDGDPSSVKRAHLVVQKIQSVVAQFDGAVSLNLDEKGITVVVAFGLPGMAHTNDPERAIRVAQRLQAELADLSVRTGIGVATGPAFCGSFVTGSRSHYTIHGDAINLAAGLMQSSAVDILCHEETAEAVRGRYTFEVLPPIAVKGKQQPVRVYRPRAYRVEPTYHDGVIGRAAERAVLKGHLTALAAGESGVVTVEGEPGIGKSRLLADLAREGRKEGVVILAANADAIERTSPYFAWRPIVAQIFGMQAELSAEGVASAVRDHLEDRPDLHRFIPLLNAVLPVEIPDSEVTADMTGAARADGLKALVVGALDEYLRGRPALLLVEDAQWLDFASMSLLHTVAGALDPLLMVLAARTEEGSGLEELFGAEGAERLLLGGLEPEEVDGLVRQLLGVAEIPAELGSFIQSRSAGHPLFCEELLHTMREMGVVRVQGGRCKVDQFESVELPTTVEGMILGRFDRLTPEEQRCLKLASVIGRVFSADLVRDVYPDDAGRARVGEYLESLRRHDLTAEQVVDGQSKFVFRHELIRSVVYGVMVQSQREPLHRRVAEWYERNYPGEDLEPYFPLLAHHWAMASDNARTLRYLEGAAEQALKRGAFEEARLFFNQALALQAEAELPQYASRVASWQSGLGSAFWYTGDLDRGREHLEKALEHIDRAVPDQPARVAAGVLRGIVHQAMHRLFRGGTRSRRADEETVRLNAGVDAYRVLGQIAYINGEPPMRMLYLTVAGLNLGETAGPSPALARILINAGVTSSVLGFRRLADYYARAAIRTAQGEGRSSAIAYVWHLSALIHAQRGDWEEALEASEKGRALFRRVGDENLEAELLILRALIHLCAGNFQAAPESWRRSEELGRRNGNNQILCWSLLQQAETLVGMGEIEAADEALESALAVPTAEADGTSAIQKQRNTAAVRFHQGRYDEATASALAVLDRLDDHLSTAFHAVESVAYAVEILIRCLPFADEDQLDDLSSAARHGLKRLQRIARRFGCLRPRTYLCRGLLQAFDGRPEAARREWNRGVDLAAEMNMPYDRALLLLELARVAEGADREALQSRAAALFDEAGATPASSPQATADNVPG